MLTALNNRATTGIVTLYMYMADLKE